jgi:hypothetical protein
MNGVAVRAVAARPQLTTAAAQLAGGAGNLLYALALARMLPGEFGAVAAFLAAYLVIHIPLTSLTAAVAVHPGNARALGRRVLVAGCLAGAVVLALAPLAPAVGWTPALGRVLALTLPGAGLLAIARGRLLATRQDSWMAATLVIEPAARLTLGLALASRFGAPGAALGVVAGGYAALAIAAAGGNRAMSRDAGGPAALRARGPVAATFIGLAVVQTQDVLLAAAVLSASQSAQFGALSTLGGIAAFATSTVPLVLLPRAAAREPGALRDAVLVALGLGVAALLPALLAPRLLVTTLFGAAYADVAPLAAPYLAAMALLGVARVLLAWRATLRPGLMLAAVLVSAAGVQALLVLRADSATGVARATVLASLVLMAGAALLARMPATKEGLPLLETVDRAPASAPAAARPARAARDRWVVAALMLGGLVLRLFCGRSLWLDEATSVSQAQMPFGKMLDQLRYTDVHPPLHDALLWVLAHAFGTSALLMRAPSLLAGTALIGVLYLAGRELWDRRAGLVAAMFATVAPFALWYSQEARMYALFMLFAALAIYGQARVARRNDRGGWLIWTAATILMLWTHYFAVLAVGVQVLAFVAMIWRRRGGGVRQYLLPALAAALVIALVCTPLAVFVHHQFVANQASGRGFTQTPSQTGAGEAGHQVPGPYAALTNVVWALWGYHSSGTMARLTALWPLLILLALALLGRGRDRAAVLLWALALVPLAVLFGVGQLKPFLFEARYFAGAVPALLLLLARGATGWTRGLRGATAAAAIAAALVTASFAAGAADQQLSQTNPRLYDFRGALQRIEARARPGDRVVYEPYYLDDLVRYYAPGLHARALDPQHLPTPARGHRIFLLASFQEDPVHAGITDEALRQLARHHGFVGVIRRPQVEVWIYR